MWCCMETTVFSVSLDNSLVFGYNRPMMNRKTQPPTYDELIAIVRYLADKSQLNINELPIAERKKEVIAECFRLYYNRAE